MSPQIEQVGILPYAVYVTASFGGFTVFVSYRKDGSINVVTLEPEPAFGGRSRVFTTFGEAIEGQENKAMRELLHATCGAAFAAVSGDFWEFLNKPLDL